jgi:hypothetical protein
MLNYCRNKRKTNGQKILTSKQKIRYIFAKFITFMNVKGDKDLVKQKLKLMIKNYSY